MARKPTQPLVMVIDDDDPTRMMATEFLTQSGFQVVDFSSGSEALEHLERHDPDLVLLDVEMPEMDGFTVCRRIRSRAGFETTPILMLTGLNNNESIDVAFDAGATDFSAKPINWTLLGHRLRYMMRAWQSAYDLADNQRSLASAQRIAQLGNWELNLANNEMTWSLQLYAIFGCTDTDQSPTLASYLKFIHADDLPRVHSWLSHAKSHQLDSSHIEFRIQTECGTERYVRQQVEQVVNKDGEIIRLQGVMQDFTEHHEAENRIEQLAYYDCVTDLPNRTLFSERVDSAIEIAERNQSQLAILYIDIDDFKVVNDTLGHSWGDTMLKEIANRISDCVSACTKNPDADYSYAPPCVARMGADEFTVMLTDFKGNDDINKVANKILDKLSLPYSLNEGEVFTSSSIGIAQYPNNGDRAESIIKNADMAMSIAKRGGKNLIKFHDESMDEEAQKRFRIESHLRHGLERDEFVVHYQPQIDLQTGQAYCAEALVRWVSPELGFVSPGDFISIAEANGFIVPLGEWVLRTSCAQAKQWLDSGFPITQVAVNISVLQFIRADFPDTVRRILEETGLPANHLELEITESLLATDTHRAVDTLRTLKSIGVELSIDDFGTGYSSLSQLKHFPIDRLKLDQSFVQGITTSREDAAITRAVIAMTTNMKVKLLAEGVETREQLEYLKRCNCSEIQGYFISKPMPADALADDMNQISELLGELFDGDGNLRQAA